VENGIGNTMREPVSNPSEKTEGQTPINAITGARDWDKNDSSLYIIDLF
jgi:hypothetical protein